MKVLVTGGAGFIGSHIVDLLVARGAAVVVLDDLSRGREENLHPEAKFYPLDIRSREVQELLDREQVDYVIHQAAQIDVQASINNPQFDASVNILGTLNLLEACRDSGVKKVVYASSAAVYGEPCYLPIDEKHPLQAQSGYGLSKQVGERYLALFRDLYGLDMTVLRYANVYGPRQDASGEGGVVAVFTDKLLKGETPVIFGSGEQTRDFVYVDDVARANVLALEQGGSCLNVSTGEETPVNQLYLTLKDLLGEGRDPRHEDARPGDIHRSYLSHRLMAESWNWRPETPLAQGLQRTLDHRYKELQRAGAAGQTG